MEAQNPTIIILKNYLGARKEKHGHCLQIYISPKWAQHTMMTSRATIPYY